MIDLLHDMSERVVGFAGSDWAVLALCIESFTEAIFFPVPPDPLLVGIAVIQPHLAILLGVLVTVSSVAGAVVGHWIGRRFGRPLLYRLVSRQKVDLADRILRRYGVGAILIAAFTPIPYKVFAISAGALNMDSRAFILASLVGRGVRFISLGALVFFFGESIQVFITENFEVLTMLLALTVLVAAVGWSLVHSRRRARDAMR